MTGNRVAIAEGGGGVNASYSRPSAGHARGNKDAEEDSTHDAASFHHSVKETFTILRGMQSSKSSFGSQEK